MGRNSLVVKLNTSIGARAEWIDPSRLKSVEPADLRRFWSFVNKKGPVAEFRDDRCWEWTGSTSKSGHGKFSLKGKTLQAHRFAYLLGSGEEPAVVRHLCGNPACVRFNHLAAGDTKDNLLDMLIHRWQSSSVD